MKKLASERQQAQKKRRSTGWAQEARSHPCCCALTLLTGTLEKYRSRPVLGRYTTIKEVTGCALTLLAGTLEKYRSRRVFGRYTTIKEVTGFSPL